MSRTTDEIAELCERAYEHACRDVETELGPEYLEQMRREYMEEGDDNKYDYVACLIRAREVQLLKEWRVFDGSD